MTTSEQTPEGEVFETPFIDLTPEDRAKLEALVKFAWKYFTNKADPRKFWWDIREMGQYDYEKLADEFSDMLDLLESF